MRKANGNPSLMQCRDTAAAPLELQPIWLYSGPYPNDKGFSPVSAQANAEFGNYPGFLSALGCMTLHKATATEGCLLILTT